MDNFLVCVENPSAVKRNKNRPAAEHEPVADRMIVEVEDLPSAIKRVVAAFGSEWTAVQHGPVPTSFPKKKPR